MYSNNPCSYQARHDGVIAWKRFPYYRTFVRGIHRPPVDSAPKGQWCWVGNWTSCWTNSQVFGDLKRLNALMFSLICALDKRLSKQSWGWWSETPSRPLWRHCNAYTRRCVPASDIGWSAIYQQTRRRIDENPRDVFPGKGVVTECHEHRTLSHTAITHNHQLQHGGHLKRNVQ